MKVDKDVTEFVVRGCVCAAMACVLFALGVFLI